MHCGALCNLPASPQPPSVTDHSLPFPMHSRNQLYRPTGVLIIGISITARCLLLRSQTFDCQTVLLPQGILLCSHSVPAAAPPPSPPCAPTLVSTSTSSHPHSPLADSSSLRTGPILLRLQNSSLSRTDPSYQFSTCTLAPTSCEHPKSNESKLNS